MSREILEKISPWDEAIKDAQNQLVEAKRRVFRLEEAIVAFKENKKRGESWPGESASH